VQPAGKMPNEIPPLIIKPHDSYTDGQSQWPGIMVPCPVRVYRPVQASYTTGKLGRRGEGGTLSLRLENKLCVCVYKYLLAFVLLQYDSLPIILSLGQLIPSFPWQIAAVNLTDRKDSLRKFRFNSHVGIIIFLSMVAGSLLKPQLKRTHAHTTSSCD